MLTRKQYELLVYIDRHLKQTGFSPSFEEMKDALNLKSKSGIHRLISALEERGYLARRHHRARALDVLRLPDNMVPRDTPANSPPEADVPSGFSPNVIRGDFTQRLPGVRATSDVGAIQLPMYGRIAAGLPIEALRDSSSFIEVPMALLGPGEHYGLEVAGELDDRGRNFGGRYRHHPKRRNRREWPDSRSPGRRHGGHPQAPAPPRQLDRAGAL